jgi:hypothetical protein
LESFWLLSLLAKGAAQRDSSDKAWYSNQQWLTQTIGLPKTQKSF